MSLYGYKTGTFMCVYIFSKCSDNDSISCVNILQDQIHEVNKTFILGDFNLPITGSSTDRLNLDNKLTTMFDFLDLNWFILHNNIQHFQDYTLDLVIGSKEQ